MECDICPECGIEVSSPTNRLVQDSCGHKKCRNCLLNDEVKCKLCDIQNKVSSSKETVIKCCSVVSTLAAKIKTETEIITIVKHELDEFELSKQETIKKSSAVPQHITFKQNPVSYHCTMCNKTFHSKSNVRYHLYCSGEKKPFQCSACGKEFISGSHLKVHLLSHTNTKPHVCETCGKAFSQKGKLNRHVQLHSGVRAYACKECDKSFFNKDALGAHVKIHSSKKKMKCSFCPKMFTTTSNLKKHIDTHNTEKTHVCEQCGKKFKIKWALTMHRRSFHLRQKPHECSVCAKAFSISKDLKRHKLIHLDVKPYNCGACGTSFRRKDNLERHMKNTHPGKDVAPVVNKLPTCQPQAVIVEKPNAIKVITAACAAVKTEPHSKPVPVINGPFKLAFKTSAFKNNYNILRDYTEPPKIHPKKPYDLEESVNICKRILSPHSPPRRQPSDPPAASAAAAAVAATQKDSAEEISAEICQKIMTPATSVPTTLHYETSFEHKKHAIIKNIKFKLPSNYTNIVKNVDKSDGDDVLGDVAAAAASFDSSKDVKCCGVEVTAAATTSVIVNNSSNAASCAPEIHWRRRTLQNLNPKYT